MQKQVNKTHYEFGNYIDKKRWGSLWHQLDEVIKLKPNKVLEIGPGPGVFKAIATQMGLKVETLDLDPELNPDHLASVLDMPFADDSYDVVCAFQMLEHLPYEQSLEAFKEMARIAATHMIISLPDASKRWRWSIHVPMIGPVKFSMPKPKLRLSAHRFDGEHYWELNKLGYPLEKIISDFTAIMSVKLLATYRVDENPYHRFFVFSMK